MSKLNKSFQGGDIRENTLAFLENARSQIPALGSCREPLKLPLNVQYKCQDGINTCKLTCKNNYYFPEGLSSLNIVCMNSKWVIEGVEWSELPACTREFINFTILVWLQEFCLKFQLKFRYIKIYTRKYLIEMHLFCVENSFLM